jgi:DNA-binding NarL/FixJ family response regulator
VGDDRKLVAVLGENGPVVRAIRARLNGYDVVSAPGPDLLPQECDAIVLHLEGQTDSEIVQVAATLAPTLVLAERGQMVDAVDAGCRGFLPSSASLDEINKAVTSLLDGGAVVPPDLLGTLLRHLVERRRRDRSLTEHLDILTGREREVFQLAAQGSRKEEIGKRLFISSATARTHLQRVYKKLGVHSQSELMALAVRMGVFEPEAK